MYQVTFVISNTILPKTHRSFALGVGHSTCQSSMKRPYPFPSSPSPQLRDKTVNIMQSTLNTTTGALESNRQVEQGFPSQESHVPVAMQALPDMPPSQLQQSQSPLRQKRLASVSWNSQVGQEYNQMASPTWVWSRVPLPATFPRIPQSVSAPASMPQPLFGPAQH